MCRDSLVVGSHDSFCDARRIAEYGNLVVKGSLLASTSGCSDLARAHQFTNVALQELVVVIQLIVFLADGFDAVEDGHERVLKCFGVPFEHVSMRRQVTPKAETYIFISSLAACPILLISSLVLRGLMARTSSGPKCDSTGPTSKLSRGTTRGPLLRRLGKRGRIGIGWRIVPSSLSCASDPEEDETAESERAIGRGWS